MITVFNPSNYAQQWFFDKAFAVLKAKGKLTEDEEKIGRFLSLDGYFAHIKDLIAIKPSYVLIPSDETPFNIDANSRTITIPPDFVKCAGVVGDNMCEIVTFTIDRYFDYVDLATANICIQWVTPSGEEGISHVNLIDLQTIPGKIRFGWPLTKELTKKAGNISFSVRFFIKNEDKFVYLFNTLSNSFTIRNGLNIASPKVEETDVYNLFNSFVQNSNNPSYPTPAPVYFNNDPGLNLPAQDKLDLVRDTLTMKAQAIVEDNGYIKYNWYFKEDATPSSPDYKFVKATVYNADETYYEYDSQIKNYIEAKELKEEDFSKKTYYTSELLEVKKLTNSDVNYNIEETYEEIIPRPTKRNGGEQYYRKLEVGGDVSYQLITEKDLSKESGPIYERFTTLQIVPNAAKNITGLYWVGATNYVGADVVEEDDITLPSVNSTTEIESKRCYIPTPGNIIITKDLPEDIFLTREREDMPYKATLTIETEQDLGLPERTYTWKQKGKATPLKVINEGTAAGDSLIIEQNIEYETDPVTNEKIIDASTGLFKIISTGEVPTGWYSADIKSKLNRSTKDESSAICRVLEPIRAPKLAKLEFARWSDTLITPEDQAAYFENNANWVPVFDDSKAEGSKINEMTQGSLNYGTIARFRVVTDLDTEVKTDRTGFVSDKLEYNWYIIEPDNPNPIKLNVEEHSGDQNYLPMGEQYAGLGQKEIDIRNLERTESPVYLYCEVVNTLAKETKTLSKNDYTTLFKLY